MVQFNQEAFGKRVAELRKERGFTQNKLAIALGIDQASLSLIERGKRFSFDTLFMFATYFNVSFDFLLGFSSKREITDVDRDNVDYLIIERLKTFSRSEKEKILKLLECYNSLK